MKNGFLEPLEISSGPDRGRQFVLLLTLPWTVLAIWMAALPLPLRGLAASGALVSVLLELRVLGYGRPAQRVRRAVMSFDGGWLLYTTTGDVMPAQLAAAWGASAGPVMGLEWYCVAGRPKIWLLRRDVSPQTWRRLRVRLRMS